MSQASFLRRLNVPIRHDILSREKLFREAFTNYYCNVCRMGLNMLSTPMERYQKSLKLRKIRLLTVFFGRRQKQFFNLVCYDENTDSIVPVVRCEFTLIALPRSDCILGAILRIPPISRVPQVLT